MLTKVCKVCKREFPKNTDYYFKRNDTKDGFTSKCKECHGKQFTNKLSHIPKNGYKFCIKCDRELLNDIKYFPPDKSCKSGFKNVCRECGKDGHFMKDGYKKSHYWTKEENELFIKVYSHYTNEELINLYFPNATLKCLMDKAYRMGVSNKTEEVIKRANKQRRLKNSGENSVNYGKPMSEDAKRKLSIAKTGKYVGENSPLYGIKWDIDDKRRKQISDRKKGEWAGDKNPRHINPLNGELNGRWNGGIKELYFDLRDHLQKWKQQSMENCNYKCVLTNGNFDNIHHLYSFRNIVNEVFDELELPIHKTIGEYSKKERNNIYKLLEEKHLYYGYGKCICKVLHQLFHNTYGYYNNTPEQYFEFEKRYKNYDFDDLLEDKYKYCNIELREVKKTSLS